MPSTQAGHCTKVAPIIISRSVVPSGRCASTQDPSTTAWPSSARRNRPPCRLRAAAAAIGTNRRFIRAPAPIPVTRPAPPDTAVMKANWADPENTRADMRMVAAGGQPASVAYAPNVTASAAAAKPEGHTGSDAGSPAPGLILNPSHLF